MSILSIPLCKPLKNNSHHPCLGNAMVYFIVVQILFLPICTISEELVIAQAVGGNQVIFCNYRIEITEICNISIKI